MTSKSLSAVSTDRFATTKALGLGRCLPTTENGLGPRINWNLPLGVSHAVHPFARHVVPCLPRIQKKRERIKDLPSLRFNQGSLEPRLQSNPCATQTLRRNGSHGEPREPEESPSHRRKPSRRVFLLFSGIFFGFLLGVPESHLFFFFSFSLFFSVLLFLVSPLFVSPYLFLVFSFFF